MTVFSEAQVEALRDLRRVWPDRPMTLIGAGGLTCHTGLWWRSTMDLDLVLVIESEAFPGPLLNLPGWRRSEKLEHAWTSPGGALLDLLPVSAAELSVRAKTWPQTGQRMTLVGYRHLQRDSTTLSVTEGVEVTLAGLHIIALLKMVSFLEQPFERRRDLTDLAHLLAEGLPADDERRFAEDVLTSGATFETASAFVLGRHLRGIVDDEELAVVDRFLRHARSEGDGLGVRWELQRSGPPSWRDDEGPLDDVLGAFARGIGLPA